jgi:hypothetical protein
MDYVHLLTAARVVQSELISADAALEAGPSDHAIRLVLMKHLLVAIANVADLESGVRSLYKDNSGLSDLVRPHKKALEFVKYLRNICVGHINPALCSKTIEWRPELNEILKQAEPDALAFVNYAVLETAINTYVGPDGHKYFDSETDLAYPPDMTRFLNFLGQTVHGAIAFVQALAEIAISAAQLPDYREKWLELSMKAGGTEFTFITKGRA